MTFGTKLKQLRKAAGLTQFELSRLAEIDRTTLARLETDRTVPTWPVVVDLAKVLKVSVEVFPSTPRSMGPKPSRSRLPQNRTEASATSVPAKKKGADRKR